MKFLNPNRRLRIETLFARLPLSASGWDTEGQDTEGQDTEATVESTEYRWHNSKRPEDVDRNDALTAIDALIIINELNQSGSRRFTADETLNHDVDVNHDGGLTPIDALSVINALNAEGENFGSPFDSSPVDDSPAHAPGYDVDHLLESNTWDDLLPHDESFIEDRFDDFHEAEHLERQDETPEHHTGNSSVNPIDSGKLSARLLGSGRGKVEYEKESRETKFEVAIRAVANSSYPVEVDGVSVGEIRTDSSGRGKLEFEIGDDEYRPFPFDFPTIGVGSTVTVGDIMVGQLVASNRSDHDD